MPEPLASADIRPRVIVLDDDAFVGASLADWDEIDADVCFFDDVDSAVESLKSARFDVIVSDMRMDPGLSFDAVTTRGGHETGLAFIKLAHQLNPSAGLVLVSAVESESARSWCLKNARARFYLKTRVEPSDLAATVLKLAAGSRNLRMGRLDCVFDAFRRSLDVLQSRHESRSPFVISDEYDVQDLLVALIHVNFTDVRKEELVSSVGGSGSRVDILVRDIAIAIEVKYVSPLMNAKRLLNEIMVDIVRYRAIQHCDDVVFFVFDPARRLRNVSGIERDIAECSTSNKSYHLRVVT